MAKLKLFPFFFANFSFLFSYLQQVNDINLFSSVREIICFNDCYEKPFLKGFPDDIDIKLLKKNACGPHCWEKFRLPNPWLNINYPRIPYLAIMSNCFIDCASSGTVFNASQQLILRYQNWQSTSLVRKNFNKVKKIHIDEAFHLLQPCGEGYYHFIIELVPRILLVLNFIRSKPNAKILIKGPYKSFMQDFFEMLGLNKDRILVCNDQIIKVDKLYYPRPAFMGYPSREELLRIRNFLKNDVHNNDLIVIIDRKEDRRRSVNSLDLLNNIKKEFPALEDKVVLFSGNMSLMDQIDLFSKAKIILAPHGAGLANMVFSKSNIDIVEFMPQNFFSILYWHLSYALNNKHHFISISGAGFYSDINIPVGQVIECLRKILN